MAESSGVTPKWINIGQPYNDPIHRRASLKPHTQACSLMLDRPDPAPKNRMNLPWEAPSLAGDRGVAHQDTAEAVLLRCQWVSTRRNITWHPCAGFRVHGLPEIRLFRRASCLQQRVRERTQLHRVVAENSWMFGEQYHLSVDDQSLTEVLKKHIEAQGREVEIDTPVKRADGSRGIVDLMFSRNIQLAGAEDREHLVVELKRPNVRINAEAATQIESYAFAVADDERFRAVPAKWVFWAVSNDLDQVVARKASQKDRAHGILFQDEEQRITIWVKTWSQVINDCKARLRFFEEKLNYTPDRDSSLEHLNRTYNKYLADLFTAKSETDEVEEDASEANVVAGRRLRRARRVQPRWLALQIEFGRAFPADYAGSCTGCRGRALDVCSRSATAVARRWSVGFGQFHRHLGCEPGDAAVRRNRRPGWAPAADPPGRWR